MHKLQNDDAILAEPRESSPPYRQTSIRRLVWRFNILENSASLQGVSRFCNTHFKELLGFVVLCLYHWLWVRPPPSSEEERATADRCNSWQSSDTRIQLGMILGARGLPVESHFIWFLRQRTGRIFEKAFGLHYIAGLGIQ